MKLNQIPEVMLEKEDLEQIPTYKCGFKEYDIASGYNSALTAQGEVEVELDIGKIVDIIWEWAEEQGAIDKYGEITLSYEGQNVKDIAQALSDNLPNILRRMR